MYYFIIASLSVLGICNIRSTSGSSHCEIRGILLSNIDFHYFLNWDFSCSPEYNATEKVFFTVTTAVRGCSHQSSVNGTFDTWVEFDDGFCHRKSWKFTIAASINGSEIANASHKYYGLGRADKIALSPPITTLSNNCGDTKIYLRPSIPRLGEYNLEYSVRLYYLLPGNQTVLITKDVKEHKTDVNSTMIEKSVSNVSSTICVEASFQITFNGNWKSSPTTVCENSTCSDAEQTRTTTERSSTSPSSDMTSMTAIIATGVILLLAVVFMFLRHQWRAIKSKKPEWPNSTKQVINSQLCDAADEVVWKSEYLSMIKPLVQFESNLDGCEKMDSNSLTAGTDFPNFQKHSETASSSSDTLPENESVGYVSEVCLSREVRSQNSSNQNFDPGMEEWCATTLDDGIQAAMVVECEELATYDRNRNPSTSSAFCDNATDKELSLAPMPAGTLTIDGDDCSDVEYVMLPIENEPN